MIKIFRTYFLVIFSTTYSFSQTSGVGINTTTPGNALEINSGTSGNSGLRFTQLNSTSTAITNPTNKILGLNNTGDVTLYQLPSGTNSFVSVVANYDTNTPNNTVLTLGELQFRFDGLGGTGYSTWGLSFRSSSASTLPITCISHREYQSNLAIFPQYIGADFFSSTYTLNDNSGTYTRIDSGGLTSDSMLVYTIVVDSGSIYKINVTNRSNSKIYIWGRKIR
ncbi:MAG: hypothetical protein QM535_14665 [Limnohabitans sp.]|nr:hypothetical protein [Limnohabitans sp.]